VKQLEQQYQTLQDVTSAIDTSLINTRLDKLEDKVSKMEQKLKNLQTLTAVLIEDIPPTTDKYPDVTVKEEKIEEEEKEEADATIAAVEAAVTNDVTVPYYEKDEIPKAIDKITDKIRRISPEMLASRVAHLKIHQDVATLKQDVIQIKQELQNLNERIEQREIPTIAPLIKEEKPVVERELIKEQIVEVSAANLEQCLEAVRNVETTHGNALRDVTQRVIALEKEIGHLLERMDRLQKVDKKDDIDINELVTNMQRIETDMEKIEQAMGSILDDKETKDAHIKTLLEQIELLKTIKANKEDLKDALADKADTQTMNRKVSHDKFNAACDDLARGLEEAINKLTKQESIWQQALDNVQNEIATKMDKAEMTPLMDFVHKKLKSLQEKLKIIVEARREIEAAGTKKMLRDVQCISCDKDVVMKREEVVRYRVGPLPCTISMKPYLTYELDQVRRQQRRLPCGRNMIQFEAAMQEKVRCKKTKMKEELLAKTPGAHLCNRYCGGSHTVTTPQQRVLRTGHFLTQWGPEMIQLTDGLIRGKDGQMYRSRLLSDVCGPTCWESQTSEETRSSVNINMI
ncbi:glutamine-rich protein 2-like, partial [Pogonomyrmex barbatus]|uniref:Glutamine-rich protein 2-like n=1 Tax=Pogonomyrmex barbatus TaxID=144034 RepID=A0A8N1S9Q8_9HYME